MVSDIAHALSCTWRSLTEQQTVVNAGYFGKTCALKPFDKLKRDELLQELQSRGINCDGLKKPQLEAELTGILRGFQRVPALLLQDPKTPLASLKLEQYTILDCEPLHDLKGHLENIFSELLSLLPQQAATVSQEILDATVNKEKAKGSDYRAAAVFVLLCLYENSVEGNVLKVMETIVEISEIFYSAENKRNPRQILRLFNITWLHGELCAEIFAKPSSITSRKMYGIYFHAIVSHAAPQYEILCLKSTNAEDNERLFGQAESITGNTSNRHPNHVIPNLLLRIQAQATKHGRDSLSEQQSRISKAAQQLPKRTNTFIERSFVEKKTYSWQAHLIRIAPFLQPGPGVWWKEVDGNFEFLNGPDEQEFQPQGPPLTHFRTHTLKGLLEEKKKVWEDNVAKGISLPCTVLRVYDSDGDLMSTHEVTPMHENNDTELPEEWDCPDLATVLADPIDLDDQQPNSEVHQQEDSTSNSEQNTQVYSFKTTWGKRIAEVIGISKKIIEFDPLRAEAKTAKQRDSKGSRSKVDKHDHLLAHIQSQVLARHTEISRQIEQYEMQHLREENLSLPDMNTDTHYANLVYTRNLSEKLLKTWSITFTA